MDASLFLDCDPDESGGSLRQLHLDRYLAPDLVTYHQLLSLTYVAVGYDYVLLTPDSLLILSMLSLLLSLRLRLRRLASIHLFVKMKINTSKIVQYNVGSYLLARIA
eukprot:scaffold63152_cov51-Attheya_sp.AAC.3